MAWHSESTAAIDAAGAVDGRGGRVPDGVGADIDGDLILDSDGEPVRLPLPVTVPEPEWVAVAEDDAVDEGARAVGALPLGDAVAVALTVDAVRVSVCVALTGGEDVLDAVTDTVVVGVPDDDIDAVGMVLTDDVALALRLAFDGRDSTRYTHRPSDEAPLSQLLLFERPDTDAV